MNSVENLAHKDLVSVEDYFALCEKIGMYFEYLAGVVVDRQTQQPILPTLIAQMLAPDFDNSNIDIAMATFQHRTIISNIQGLCYARLAHPFKVHGQDAHIFIAKTGKYRVPDITVFDKNKAVYNEKKELLNPIVLFEVLSSSTKDTDLVSKLEEYTSIEALTDYIVIGQEEYWVKQYTRMAEATWKMTTYQNSEQVLPIVAVNLELSLQEVYRDVF
jgi:Uma2 family endonuclease